MWTALLAALCCACLGSVAGQIAYRGLLSELRIQELTQMAIRLNHSINWEKYACESFFDYACSNNQPLYSIMGHMPRNNDLMELLTKLENDPQEFEAKQKLIDFFISCSSHKAIADCYRETFEYFKPLFGYIITKDIVNGSSHELRDFLAIVNRFVNKTVSVFNSHTHPLWDKYNTYKEKFKTPRNFFYVGELNQEFASLRIYRESYEHNIRNLDIYRKRNSTYNLGVPRTMLDWSLYMYQSRNKPMSYYYATFTVHLYMTMFNITERIRDYTYFRQELECLKLPPYVSVLDEARMLAVIYLKSFRHTWQDYSGWIMSDTTNSEIYAQEDRILQKYKLNNKRLFFTLFAQNFCEFGKELAENVFYLGLKQNVDFYSSYSCGFRTEAAMNCV